MLSQNNKIRVEHETAIILHRRVYRETSLLLELITESHGRVALICKGARRAKGKIGLLQPFQLLLCCWQSKSDLGILTNFELATSDNHQPLEPPSWQPKLEGSVLYCGLYINELIMRCTERGQDIEGLLRTYRIAIDKLHNGYPEAAVLREFEWSLVSLLGYGVSFIEDSQNQPINENLFYYYQPDVGLIQLPERSPKAISGKTLLELAKDNWHNDSIIADTRKLTKQALAPLIGNKPFASRGLYLGLKKYQKKSE